MARVVKSKGCTVVKEIGKSALCGAPTVDGVFCEQHRKEANKRVARAREILNQRRGESQSTFRQESFPAEDYSALAATFH